jgi:hypothetical protein
LIHISEAQLDGKLLMCIFLCFHHTKSSSSASLPYSCSQIVVEIWKQSHRLHCQVGHHILLHQVKAENYIPLLIQTHGVIC